MKTTTNKNSKQQNKKKKTDKANVFSHNFWRECGFMTLSKKKKERLLHHNNDIGETIQKTEFTHTKKILAG